MKKLLILSSCLTFFILFSCKSSQSSTPEEVWYHEQDTLKNILYSYGLPGLLSLYTNNVCNKNVYSLSFNGNNYSKMALNSIITDKDLEEFAVSVSEVLEEKGDIVTYTDTRPLLPGGKKIIVTYTFNKKTKEFKYFESPQRPVFNNLDISLNKTITQYCNWVQMFEDSVNDRYEIAIHPTSSKDLNINGKNISISYTMLKRSVDIHDVTYHTVEYWIAINSELKGITLKRTKTFPNQDNAYTSIAVQDFSFTKK